MYTQVRPSSPGLGHGCTMIWWRNAATCYKCITTYNVHAALLSSSDWGSLQLDALQCYEQFYLKMQPLTEPSRFSLYRHRIDEEQIGAQSILREYEATSLGNRIPAF